MVDKALTQTYTLQLTMEGPCQVGAGTKLTKKEYYYNRDENTVTFYDPSKLMECIFEQNQINAYESYMLNPKRALYSFFQNAGGTEPYNRAKLYTVDCGDAFAPYGTHFPYITTHIRNGLGQAYVPGSSVKGMLRTAVTVACILKKMPKARKPVVPMRPYFRGMRDAAAQTMAYLDTELYHTLGLPNENYRQVKNAVNSILRGVAVADSEPVENSSLVLCRKIDLNTYGESTEVFLVRECIRPGVKIRVPITFDPTLAQFLTPEWIQEAISIFDDWYTQNVLSHHENVYKPALTNHLFLGGGSGYFSKTVTGPWLQDDATHYIETFLTTQFGGKNRNDEKRYGISPHMLKYTVADGDSLPFGLCKVDFL